MSEALRLAVGVLSDGIAIGVKKDGLEVTFALNADGAEEFIAELDLAVKRLRAILAIEREPKANAQKKA